MPAVILNTSIIIGVERDARSNGLCPNQGLAGATRSAFAARRPRPASGRS
jgi:hypothetical protein